MANLLIEFEKPSIPLANKISNEAKVVVLENEEELESEYGDIIQYICGGKCTQRCMN